jgi:hypothetical protein
MHREPRRNRLDKRPDARQASERISSHEHASRSESSREDAGILQSRSNSAARRRLHVAASLAAVFLPLALSGCASVSFERETATSGTFKSSGWSITILQMDFPKGALSVARENASDANMANMVVENVTQIPSWPPLDWLFDIFSIRYASVSGSWGFTGQENQSPQAKP